MAARTALVMGIDPGVPRERASASWSVLTLAPTGAIGLVTPAPVMTRPELQAFLRQTPLLSDERMRLIAMGAPLTAARLERKPLKARLVEIRFARGAFAGAKRGPQPAWISSARTGWKRYQQGAELQHILQQRGFPLYPMPPEGVTPELPSRACFEVLPRATLTVLLPRTLLVGRPIASEFMGQIDDWLFPQAFLRRSGDEAEEGASTRAPIEDVLDIVAPGLHFAPETLLETERIAGIRRPFSRREPLRAFLAALQGVLALSGAACLIGVPGETEGSYLMPATWHPDWEEEWARPAEPQVRRVKLALPGEG